MTPFIKEHRGLLAGVAVVLALFIAPPIVRYLASEDAQPKLVGAQGFMQPNSQGFLPAGPGGSGSAPYSPSGSGSTTLDWYEEFDGNAQSALTWDHAGCASVSGNCSVGGTSERPGLALLTTSTSATAHTRVATVNTSYSFHDTDHTVVEFKGVAMPTLSDGTESYDIFCGFADSVTNANQADGAYFLAKLNAGGNVPTGGANQPTATTNWQILTAANSVFRVAALDGVVTDTQARTVTAGDAGLVPATGTVYNLKVDCTTARCDFYMAEQVGGAAMGSYVRVGSACSSGCSMTEVAIPPAVTNSSLAANARSFGGLCSITKFAGTTARIFQIDAMAMSRTFTVGR